MKNPLRLLTGAALLASASLGWAAAPLIETSFNPTNGVLTLSLPVDPRSYYSLEWTADFQTFTKVGMSLGSPGPVWSYSVTLGPNQGFFRVQQHDIFSPVDTDGDGIDDRYELQHAGCLDALNYFDASQPCLTNGMSNYQ